MLTQLIFVFIGVVGILCIIFGARAIERKTITISTPDISEPRATIIWPDDNTYTGQKAVIVGWCFVIFGIILVLVTLLLIITDIIFG